MSLRDRLVNWSFAMTGYSGPEVPNTCASAEKHYVPEAGTIWDEPDDKFAPDLIDAQIVEKEVCSLREDLRNVIKAKYVQFPYNSNNHCAHYTRMSPKKFEERLNEAHRRLSKRLNEERV
jgi:hypothetical protein